MWNNLYKVSGIYPHLCPVYHPIYQISTTQSVLLVSCNFTKKTGNSTNAEMAGQMLQQSDDGVIYRLFPVIPEDCTDEAIAEYLEHIAETYLAHLSTFLVDYIWQNEPFNLTSSQADNAPPYMCGSTKFGDNIEDEWFIVYLLCNLTEHFPGLVVQVNDNDGEFLLIEAANTLPRWVNPDTAENRVYIYEGLLHIIPYPLTPAHIALLPTSTPTLEEAMNCIRGSSDLTVARSDVQDDIRHRLNGYPEKAASSKHCAQCYLPANLAAILENDPFLVAPTVEAFYYRDPVDLKACITFRNFQPGTRVMRMVKFTRCLYAQLMQQRFLPDKRSGFNMPPANDSKYIAYDLGMKLSHGAEILCSKSGTKSSSDSGEATFSQSRWDRFVSSLEKNGYFKGELQGSQLYTELLASAKNYFMKSSDIDQSSSSNTGDQICRLLKQVSFDVEDMKKDEKNLPPSDDDSWLNLTPDDLDAKLNKYSQHKTNKVDQTEITEGVKLFMETVSSHEGADLPKSSENDIQLDPNSFMQSMQKVFDFEDSDASSSDLDEYGSDDEVNDYSFGSKTNNKASEGFPGKQQEKDFSPNDDYFDLKHYMEVMDKELNKTHIGDSFVKEGAAPKPPPRKKKMARMSAQGTPSKSSPDKLPKTATLRTDEPYDVDALDEDFRPVNIDRNLVESLMESYKSQEGMAGPASNMLGTMGIKMPQSNEGQL